MQFACRRFLEPGGASGASYINIRPAGSPIVRYTGSDDDFRAFIDLEIVERVFSSTNPDSQTPESQPERFVTSDESLFWIDDPDNIARFADLLRPHFDDIRILCYLRRQDLLALSHRPQVIMNAPAARFYGITATPLPEYRPYFQRYFDYAEKLSSIWCAAFGKENVTVVPYARDELVNGDVVEDFAYRAGVRFRQHGALRKNASLSGSKTYLGLKMAEHDVPPKLRKKMLKSFGGTGKFLPTQEEARRFLAHFEESNERLARGWSWKGEPFTFVGDFGMYPITSGEPWRNAGTDALIDCLLETLMTDSDKRPPVPRSENCS